MWQHCSVTALISLSHSLSLSLSFHLPSSLRALRIPITRLYDCHLRHRPLFVSFSSVRVSCRAGTDTSNVQQLQSKRITSLKNVLPLCTIPFPIFLCRCFSSRAIIALAAFRTFSLLVRTLLPGLSFFSLRFQRLIRRAIISYFPATSVSPYVTWLTVSSGFFISSSRFMQMPPGYHERSLVPSLPVSPSSSPFYLRCPPFASLLISASVSSAIIQVPSSSPSSVLPYQLPLAPVRNSPLHPPACVRAVHLSRSLSLSPTALSTQPVSVSVQHTKNPPRRTNRTQSIHPSLPTLAPLYEGPATPPAPQQLLLILALHRQLPLPGFSFFICPYSPLRLVSSFLSRFLIFLFYFPSHTLFTLALVSSFFLLFHHVPSADPSTDSVLDHHKAKVSACCSSACLTMEGTLLLTRSVAFLRLNHRARFHLPLFSSFVLRDSYKEICCDTRSRGRVSS